MKEVPWSCHCHPLVKWYEKKDNGYVYCKGVLGGPYTFMTKKKDQWFPMCKVKYTTSIYWGTYLFVGLKGFWPLGNRFIFIWGFFKDDILACVETWD